MGNFKLCPKCGHSIAYDPYFKAYCCRQCGHTIALPKTAFEVASSSVENILVECLFAIAPFSICDLVCENKCTAIDNFNLTAKEQCKAKIREFFK